ncbi:hypothetical protein [Streptomyces sp. NPDC018347]|uniref:hypothetical protein n=1 Tax=Streptomyces sp. NPDC018347 TaxID=3157193 RepID=UPI0033F0D847
MSAQSAARPLPSAPHAAPLPAPYGFGPPLPYDTPEVVLADADSGAVVNAAGVLFQVGGAAADFPWHEIARVERTRRGDRLTLVVGLRDGGVYSCEPNARRKAGSSTGSPSATRSSPGT